MMRKYIQINEQGYVVSVTNKSSSVGLFDEKAQAQRYLEITDDEAKNITRLLKARHREGNGLHIDDLIISFIKN